MTLVGDLLLPLDGMLVKLQVSSYYPSVICQAPPSLFRPLIGCKAKLGHELLRVGY